MNPISIMSPPASWHLRHVLLVAAALSGASQLRGDTPPTPQVAIARSGAQFKLTVHSQLGLTNEVQFTDSLAPAEWNTLTNLLVVQVPYTATDVVPAPHGHRYYRVRAWYPAGAPTNMVFIPAGSSVMGGIYSTYGELPVHSVSVSAIYMDRTEVSKTLWDQVAQWGMAHGYQFDNLGTVKSNGHPVYNISWYDAVKWCNARSEREGRVPAYYTEAEQANVYRTGWLTNADPAFVKWTAGYRLPTEAEWEKASRGGVNGRTYPWGNTIGYSDANFSYHPTYNDGRRPYTSPVGSFPPNAYGLYDIIGNVWEWCWDYYDKNYYSVSPATDPRGPAVGTNHTVRGGAWDNGSTDTRCASRYAGFASSGISWNCGLRAVVGAAP